MPDELSNSFIGPRTVEDQIQKSVNDRSSSLEDVRSSIEKDFLRLKQVAITQETLNAWIKPKKVATSSYMNKYAFVSYGANHISGKGSEMKNTFWGDTKPTTLDGLNSPYHLWKNPTAENIIKWSKTLRKEAVDNAKSGTNQADVDDAANANGELFENPGVRENSGLTADNDLELTKSGKFSNIATSTQGAQAYAKFAKEGEQNINAQFGSGNTVSGVGNLEYEWKDFSFCKHYGKIPNNKLITLRRFKLPVMDNGVIAGKERLKNVISAGKYDPEEYLTSDSARALTYWGDDTGNTLGGFTGWSVGLNWGTLNADLKNPKINETGLQNQRDNFLNQPFEASHIVKPGIDALALGNKEINDRLWGVVSTMGLQKQIDEMKKDQNLDASFDQQAFNRLMSKENDMFSNGWQNRIYGPINVVTRTMKRERGLSFKDSSIALKFHYDVSQIGTINTKLAMLDIISNMLALTYNSGSFYGGDYRFHRQPTNFPYPDSLIDNLERMSTGDGDVDYSEMYDGLKDAGTDWLNYITKDVSYEGFNKLGPIMSEFFGAMANVSQETTSNATTTTEPKSSAIIPEDPLGLGGSISKDAIGTQTLNLEAITSTISESFGKFGEFKEALNEAGDSFKDAADDQSSLFNMILRGGLFKEGYDINKINERVLRINPLITGEPIGEWHLTVGNPMNPQMMIGNLVCKSMKMKFGEKLGPDDFPLEVEFSVSLEHGRDRDMGDIESMFNQGQGRFYTPLTDSKEPWETGFSSRNTENDRGIGSKDQIDRLEKETGESIGRVKNPKVPQQVSVPGENDGNFDLPQQENHLG